MGNEKTEKTVTTVRIFESTATLIDKWKGDLTIGQFIGNAVKSYIRHELDNGDDLLKIFRAIDQINDRQATNLGLLCEVLRQEGILNGNGEVSASKKN